MTKVTVMLTVSVTPEETQLTIQTSVPNQTLEGVTGIANIQKEVPLLLLVELLENLRNSNEN